MCLLDYDLCCSCIIGTSDTARGDLEITGSVDGGMLSTLTLEKSVMVSHSVIRARLVRYSLLKGEISVQNID